MSNDHPPPSLDELETRLREARRAAGLEPPPDPIAGQGGGDRSSSDLAAGLRIGVELVAGVVFGLALGYGIDRWLDTKPWGMIIMVLLGAIAGFMNVYRLANRQGYAAGFDKSRDSRDGGE
ncbi:AtpZ/AtpI family protein [Niveispirillum fermenti]|uniref:AtpZ/AtpI family protein n=1 Tax=Niveispirillum fermenti TaxID=1233113 RepID=UPI003A83BF09